LARLQGEGEEIAFGRARGKMDIDKDDKVAVVRAEKGAMLDDFGRFDGLSFSSEPALIGKKRGQRFVFEASERIAFKEVFPAGFEVNRNGLVLRMRVHDKRPSIAGRGDFRRRIDRCPPDATCSLAMITIRWPRDLP